MQEMEKTTKMPETGQVQDNTYARAGVLANAGRHLTWADTALTEAVWGIVCLVAFAAGYTLPWGAGALGILALSIILLVWYNASRSDDEKTADEKRHREAEEQARQRVIERQKAKH